MVFNKLNMLIFIYIYVERFAQSCIKSTVNHLNETVEGSTCVMSKPTLILKQKSNILPNISQLINCHENA